jgi:DNA-binding NarL/FixJ family response regulator
MPIRVYLADDHAVVREGLRYLLEAQGDIAVVGDAADGRQTVQEVLQLQPDVVIMDIAMPGLNGIEATRQICQANPSVRIVILSIHSTTEHILRSLKAGARGYLLKESAGQEVAEAVRAVYAGHRFLSHQIAELILEHYLEEQPGSPTDPLEFLSPREREILQLVAEGKSSSEIGQILYLSTKTVETYRSRLMQKLKIHDLPGLVRFAIQQGLIDLDGRR